MEIIDFIKVGHKNAITREELVKLTGLNDRDVRESISQTRRNVPIINLQDGKGYFIPDLSKTSEIEYLKQFVKQEENRLKSIGWSLKSARKMLKGFEVEEIPSFGEWTLCKDKMPKEGVEVLVWFEYFRYGNYNRLFQTYGLSYQFDGKFSFVNGSSGWNDLRVIAWMPLPKEFKEKKANKGVANGKNEQRQRCKV